MHQMSHKQQRWSIVCFQLFQNRQSIIDFIINDILKCLQKFFISAQSNSRIYIIYSPFNIIIIVLQIDTFSKSYANTFIIGREPVLLKRAKIRALALRSTAVLYCCLKCFPNRSTNFPIWSIGSASTAMNGTLLFI